MKQTIKKKKTAIDHWNTIEKHSDTITYQNLPKVEISLNRIVAKEKSNLNVYFGKGRMNSKRDKLIPRPWYEIEIICDKQINTHTHYPKGDFIAYTDDGYKIPMRTQGDNYKNLRSKDSLQIFGYWLKGKLEKNQVLKKYERVTLETLNSYGKHSVDLYKIKEGEYYMSF